MSAPETPPVALAVEDLPVPDAVRIPLDSLDLVLLAEEEPEIDEEDEEEDEVAIAEEVTLA